MAGLSSLLKYGLLDRRRASRVEKSGGTRLLEICIAAGLAFGFAKQIWTILTGSPERQLSAETTATCVLSLLLLLIPMNLRTAFSAEVLLVFPISKPQRLFIGVIAQILDWRMITLLVASAITILSLARTPKPISQVLGVSALLLASCIAGIGFAIGADFLRKRIRIKGRASRPPQTSRYPLLRKELGYLLRTLNPYISFLVGVAVACTEIAGRWITPGKAVISLLLIAMLQLPPLLNPFALDSESEIDRYRIMPKAQGNIVAGKHLANVLLLALCFMPLLFVIALHQSWIDTVRTLTEAALVELGGLFAAMLFMGTALARQIRMEFWKTSGESMSPALFLLASASTASVVLIPWLIHFEFRSSAVSLGTSVGTALVLLLIYSKWLRHLSGLERLKAWSGRSRP